MLSGFRKWSSEYNVRGGGFVGAGVSGSRYSSDGPLPGKSSGVYRYAEVDAGWTAAVGASVQGSENLATPGETWGWLRKLFDYEAAKKDVISGFSFTPQPKVGAGFGAWDGVGFTATGSLATPTGSGCTCK